MFAQQGERRLISKAYSVYKVVITICSLHDIFTEHHSSFPIFGKKLLGGTYFIRSIAIFAQNFLNGALVNTDFIGNLPTRFRWILFGTSTNHQISCFLLFVNSWYISFTFAFRNKTVVQNCEQYVILFHVKEWDDFRKPL